MNEHTEVNFSNTEFGLIVKDVVASKNYYCEKLGFYCQGFTYKDEQKAYCQVFRNSVAIGLWQSIDEASVRSRETLLPDYSDVIIWVSDLDAYLSSISDSVEAKRIIEGDLHSAVIEDLDAHKLQFCQEM